MELPELPALNGLLTMCLQKIAQLGRQAAMEKIAQEDVAEGIGRPPLVTAKPAILPPKHQNPEHLAGVDTTRLPPDYPGSSLRSVVDRKSVSLADVLPKGYRAGAQQHAKAWRASNPRVEQPYTQDISDKSIDRKIPATTLTREGFAREYQNLGGEEDDAIGLGGFYSPVTGRITMPSTNPYGGPYSKDRVTEVLGHELTHASQSPRATTTGTELDRYYRPSYYDDIKTYLGEASQEAYRQNPESYADYFSSRRESEAFLATIKRNYYEATGKHVTNAQEAQEALKWNDKQPLQSGDLREPERGIEELSPEARAARENWFKHRAEKMPGLVRTGSPNQFGKTAHLGRQAAMEKLGDDFQQRATQQGYKPVTEFPEFPDPASLKPPIGKFMKGVLQDPILSKQVPKLQNIVQAPWWEPPRGFEWPTRSLRGEMFKAVVEQGKKVPPTYRDTTPWSGRLLRQRHGERVLHPLLESDAIDVSKDPRGVAARGRGRGYVPKLPQFPSNDQDRVMNRNAILNHELEHGYDQKEPPLFILPDELWGTEDQITKNEEILKGLDPKSSPSYVLGSEASDPDLASRIGDYNKWSRGQQLAARSGRDWKDKYSEFVNQALDMATRRRRDNPPLADIESAQTSEIGPSIGDLIFRREQFAREEGKPLEHVVTFPGGKAHDINWMGQQAREHGYWGKDEQAPRSMSELVLKTKAGQQWYKQILEDMAHEASTGKQRPWNVSPSVSPVPGEAMEQLTERLKKALEEFNK